MIIHVLNYSQKAGGVGGLLSVTDHTTQIPLVSYPTYDGNGNISEYLTDTNNGEITSHYEYDSFGNVIKKTGNKDYSYQFSTKPFDILTGLNYYNYRSYDPTSGRWINRDPIQEKGGFNLYDFLINKPNLYYDYLGLIITPDVGQSYTQQLIENFHAIDDQEYSDSPENGQNACNGYSGISHKPCKEFRGNLVEDTYPVRAKSMCLEFIKMYTRNGKTRNAVVCVANCLVSAERKNGGYECCSKRNKERVDDHVRCYMTCGFIMDITEDNFGVPDGGWSIGLTSLLPSYFIEILQNFPILAPSPI